jgi:hypothetical protein
MLSKELLSGALNGRQYGCEITDEEAAMAKAAGLVVVFGSSDDLVEFRGAIDDELDCYGGGEFKLDEKGVLPAERNEDWYDDQMEDYLRRKKSPTLKTVKAQWCPKSLECSWLIEADVPAATFDIMEDGELFCRGIVFELAALR